MQQFKANTWRIHDIIIEPNEVYALDFMQTNPNMFMLQNPNPSPVRIGITRIPTANKYEFSVGANTSDTFGRPVGTGRLFLYNPSSANSLSITVYSNEMNFDMTVLKGINVELGNVNVESSNVIGGFGDGVKLPSGDNHIGRVSLNVDVEEAIQSIRENAVENVEQLKESNTTLDNINTNVVKANSSLEIIKDLLTFEKEKSDLPLILYNEISGSFYDKRASSLTVGNKLNCVDLSHFYEPNLYREIELNKIYNLIFWDYGNTNVKSFPVYLVEKNGEYTLFLSMKSDAIQVGGICASNVNVLNIDDTLYMNMLAFTEMYNSFISSVPQKLSENFCYIESPNMYYFEKVNYTYPTGLLINESTAFPVSVDIEQLMWLDMDNMTEYEISKGYLCDCIEEIYVKGTGGLYKVTVTDILDRQHIYFVRPDKPLKKVVKTIKGIKITTTSTSKGTVIQCKLSKMFD